MEELIYRGALLGWSARVMGVGPAVVGQAVVFGLAHSGADVIGFQLPLMLALGLGGLLAGRHHGPDALAAASRSPSTSGSTSRSTSRSPAARNRPQTAGGVFATTP